MTSYCIIRAGPINLINVIYIPCASRTSQGARSLDSLALTFAMGNTNLFRASHICARHSCALPCLGGVTHRRRHRHRSTRITRNRPAPSTQRFIGTSDVWRAPLFHLPGVYSLASYAQRPCCFIYILPSQVLTWDEALLAIQEATRYSSPQLVPDGLNPLLGGTLPCDAEVAGHLRCERGDLGKGRQVL